MVKPCDETLGRLSYHQVVVAILAQPGIWPKDKYQIYAYLCVKIEQGTGVHPSACLKFAAGERRALGAAWQTLGEETAESKRCSLGSSPEQRADPVPPGQVPPCLPRHPRHDGVLLLLLLSQVAEEKKRKRGKEEKKKHD